MTRTTFRMSFLVRGVAVLSIVAAVLAAPALAAELAGQNDRPLTFHDTPRPVAGFDFHDGEGNWKTLADFHGRVVLLNIWATWCVPCREEMPTLDRLEQKMGGPDFEVVALSVDRQGREVIDKFYREVGIKALAIYYDQSARVAGKLGIVGIPASVLIDRNGREIARKVGPAVWDSPEMVRLIQRAVTQSGSGKSDP